MKVNQITIKKSNKCKNTITLKLPMKISNQKANHIQLKMKKANCRLYRENLVFHKIFQKINWSNSLPRLEYRQLTKVIETRNKFKAILAKIT